MSLVMESALQSHQQVTDNSGRVWHIAEPRDSVIELDRPTSVDLGNSARRLAAALWRTDSIDDHETLVRAEVAMRAASPALVSGLIDFRLSSSRDGMLLLRGMPVDKDLPPTPSDGNFRGAWQDLRVSTLTQLMVMSVLGDVISYADEKDGRLIQDICPVQGREWRQENSGSCLLELHTENGFHPNKPHFLSLMGMRSDHEGTAVTVAGGIRAALPLLDAEARATLWRPEFQIRLSSSFVGTDRVACAPPTAVLSGHPDDPDLLVDLHAMQALTAGGTHALDALREAFMHTMVGTVLRPGDLLIVDNRKAVHGRTGFTPHYDGTDRWLRRCFAVTDIRASRPQLMPASRVHRPLDLAS